MFGPQPNGHGLLLRSLWLRRLPWSKQCIKWLAQKYLCNCICAQEEIYWIVFLVLLVIILKLAVSRAWGRMCLVHLSPLDNQGILQKTHGFAVCALENHGKTKAFAVCAPEMTRKAMDCALVHLKSLESPGSLQVVHLKSPENPSDFAVCMHGITRTSRHLQVVHLKSLENIVQARLLHWSKKMAAGSCEEDANERNACLEKSCYVTAIVAWQIS